MRTRKNAKKSLLPLLLVAVCVVTIGYAAINAVILEISGNLDASSPKAVIITDVQYVSDVDANKNGSVIQNYVVSTMQSTIELSNTNENSEIIYKVTVYNNLGEEATFLDVVHLEENYDNSDIIYEIQDTGFKMGDTIAAKETKEIYIKFKYDSAGIITNNVLNSYINFKIAKPNRLKKATSDGDFFEVVSRDKIEKISFELGKVPENATQTFDASANQDKSIMGYVTDVDSNGLYEITFSSGDIICANEDSSNLFYGLTEVISIEFNNFNTSNVTNMSYMFYHCSKLTSLDVSDFNTSNVTNMSSMFRTCSKLTSLDVSNFDTGKVTNMLAMFQCCSGLTSLDVSNFNTANVTNMSWIFNRCSSLTSLDVSCFGTGEVTNMSAMFQYCSGLTSLDVSNFNAASVMDVSFMFCECSGLTSLDVSNFNTSKVSTMRGLFAGCSTLTSLDLSRFNTSVVTDLAGMFQDCSKLTSLNLSSFNTSQVTDMSWMFNRCNALKTIYVTDNFNTDKVTDSDYMFNECTSLVGGNGTVFNSNNTDKKYARIDAEGAPGYFSLQPRMISFKIGDQNFVAEENMTWGEWCKNENYNTINVKIYEYNYNGTIYEIIVSGTVSFGESWLKLRDSEDKSDDDLDWSRETHFVLSQTKIIDGEVYEFLAM